MGLDEAVVRWDAGDAGGALAGLLDAWRVGRGPRLAAVIRAVPAPARDPVPAGSAKAVDRAWHEVAERGDPEDVPRLAASLLGGTANQGIARLAALPDDPRLTDALVALLDDPPRTSNGSQPFWRALVARLAGCGEPAIVPRLRALGDGYASRIPTSVGPWLGNQILKAATAIEATQPKDPEHPALESMETRLAPQLRTLHREARVAATDDRSEASLLAAVFEAPDDLGPRRVLADWYVERADPRGDWMAAQLAGDEASPPQDLALRVLGAIAGAVFVAHHRHGFAHRVWLWGTKSAVPKSIGRPEWRTVVELQCRSWPSPSYAPDAAFLRTLVRLVCDPAMVSLRRVLGPRVGELQAMADAGAVLEAIGLMALAEEDLPGLAALSARWPLAHVSIGRFTGTPAAIVDSLRPAPLRTLQVSPQAPLEDWLAAVHGLGLEGLVVADLYRQVALHLTPDGDGAFTRVAAHPIGPAPTWDSGRLADAVSMVPRITAFDPTPAAPLVGFPEVRTVVRPYDDASRAAVGAVLERHGL